MKTKTVFKRTLLVAGLLSGAVVLMSVSTNARAGGKCTGPKVESQSGLYCRCTNTSSCADKAGCGSIFSVVEKKIFQEIK